MGAAWSAVPGYLPPGPRHSLLWRETHGVQSLTRNNGSDWGEGPHKICYFLFLESEIEPQLSRTLICVNLSDSQP